MPLIQVCDRSSFDVQCIGPVLQGAVLTELQCGFHTCSASPQPSRQDDWHDYLMEPHAITQTSTFIGSGIRCSLPASKRKVCVMSTRRTAHVIERSSVHLLHASLKQLHTSPKEISICISNMFLIITPYWHSYLVSSTFWHESVLTTDL